MYGFVSAAATLFGGALPLYTRLRDVGMRYLLAFASGVLVATALLEMLPEAQLGVAPGASLALAAGFFLLYLVEKLLLIHACGEEECSTHSIGWVSVIGIGLESLIDGIAIAASFAASPVLGLVVAVAIVVHELPRGFSTAVIMKNSRYSQKTVLAVLAIDAFLTPVGVLLAPLIPISLPVLIAFAAGTFIYIGASDLLPEAHQTFNVKVVASVLVGAGVVLALETAGHAVLG